MEHVLLIYRIVPNNNFIEAFDGMCEPLNELSHNEKRYNRCALSVQFVQKEKTIFFLSIWEAIKTIELYFQLQFQFLFEFKLEQMISFYIMCIF